MSVSKERQKWYNSIKTEKFEGIAESIKKVLPVPDPQYNHLMESLLAGLTVTYMKYHESHKDDLKAALEIYELTCCLCDRFTEHANPPRLRNSIYHISRCLKKSGLYSESMTICKYITPGKILTANPHDFQFFENFFNFWFESSDPLMKSLSAKFDEKTYNILLEIIKFSFGLLKFSKENVNYSKMIFESFYRYMGKVTSSEINWSPNKIENLFYSIMEHLKTLQKNSSLEVDASLVYEEILKIMHVLSFKYIRKNQISEVSDLILKFSNEFEGFIEKDPQSQKCFELHLSFYKLFVKPVTNFDKSMLEDIRDYRRQFRSELETLGCSKAMKANAAGIQEVLTPLFNYWLECMKSCSIESINEIVFEVTKLVQYVAAIFAAQSIEKCKCGLKTCKAKKNHYEEISTLQKLGSFFCYFKQKNISEDFLHFVRDFIVKVILKIDEYKSNNCGLYSHLWAVGGQILFNVSNVCSLEYLDISAEMFSNLCSYIICGEGLTSMHTFLKCENPLSLVLHQLSLVYFRAEKFREAMIVTAFNGLISYEDEKSKAFKMWATIKHKCHSEELNKQTMISCLKTDKAAIKEIGMDINLEHYNLNKLCAREIEGLQKARVNLTPAIKASLKLLNTLQNPEVEFVEGVQRLGYTVLYFRDDCTISEYIKRGEYYLDNYDKSTVHYSCLKANFAFLKFVDQLNATSKKIKIDMGNAKNILKKDQNVKKMLDQTIETEEVVPAYRMINIKEDASVVTNLKQVLVMWENCFKKDPIEIMNCWEPEITLNMIIIAGEISRLHLAQSCEKRIWLLAYKLASVMKDKVASVYVTARSISLRYIDDLWIEKALDYTETLKMNEGINEQSATGMFWISLADFYFEKAKHKEAVKLLKNVKNLGTIDFDGIVPVYVDFVDTVIRNYQFYSEDMQQEEYSKFIVHNLYSMWAVTEILNSGGKITYYALNTILDCVNHLSLVMHSFISFMEISAHLTFQLELAQSLGATLRVAECLKSLCLIDLSRVKLNDCEIKLQGLEQILDVEGFGLSMKNKSSKHRLNIVTTSQYVDVDDPVRDVMQNEASPILGKKIFVPPEFVLHENCNCYRCKHIPYQYLVFSSSHIRAQMYALRSYSSAALQHFHGALEVRKKLLEKEESRILKESRNSLKRHPWNKYYSMVDYVVFLLDFSKFIMGYKIPREKEAMEIALEAVNICRVYNLETHPVYYAAVELIFQYRFQNLKDEIHGCPVPDAADIDILDLLPVETTSKETEKAKACLTPSHSGELPLKAIRRKKSPPFLPLTKVAMRLSDCEDEDSQPTKISRRKPRKRILNLDVDLSSDESETKPVAQMKSSSLKTEFSLKKDSVSKTTKASKILVDQPLENKFKRMAIEPKSPESINLSLEKLFSKVTELKLENFQKTPMFVFSEEDLETMRAVLNEKELQNVIQSMEEIKSFNFVTANSSNVLNSTRTSRSRSKHNSPSSEDKFTQAFEKNMRKVIDILTAVVVRQKLSKISISSINEKSLDLNLNSAASTQKPNLKNFVPSRSSSPDLFTSDDESVKIYEKENITTRIQKSKVEVLSVDGDENSDKGKRITRSRSAKISSETESVDSKSRKVSRIPRKKI